MIHIPKYLLATACMCFAVALAAEPHAHKRIVSIGPNVTETICALGARDRLVGVSEFCSYPPEVKQLRQVGGPANPRFETISALRPDLIVMQFATPAVKSFAAERGIELAEVHMDTIATIERDIGRLGALLGREDAAASITTRMRRDLDELRRCVAEIPEAKRPLVFLSVERQAGSLAGVLTASDRSFLGEALALAGGRNAFGDDPRLYGEVSRERLVARRPEAILELRGHEVTDARERDRLVRDWDAMASLPAVANKKIYVLGGEDLLVPGPRLARTVRAIHDALYSSLGRSTTSTW